MNPIRIQGLVFSIVAVIIALGSLLLQSIDQPYFLFALVALIFFLGVPHGALDPIFAKKLLALSDLKSWLQFIVVYLLLAASVVFVWWYSPLCFIVGFLIVSMLHFSRDLDLCIPITTRLLYGGAIIVLPALLHYPAMLSLFSQLVGAKVALKTVQVLYVLAMPWAILLVLAVCREFFKDYTPRHSRSRVRNRWIFSHDKARGGDIASYGNDEQRSQAEKDAVYYRDLEWGGVYITAAEIFSVALLALLAPPLISFTVFFCGMHSLRHILRTQHYASLSFTSLLVTSLLPMLGVVLLALVGWIYLPQPSDFVRIMQLLFVTLAALTVPHMLLIDRVKYVEAVAKLRR